MSLERVERGGGLVEHQDARAQGQDRGHGDLLLLAAGERGDLSVAQLGDAHGLERAGEPTLDLVVVDAEVLQAKEQLVLDHGGDHLGVDVLRHAAHRASDVGEADLAGVVAVHEGRAVEAAAVVVRHRAREHCGERGLAGSRGAGHAHELAGEDLERDAVEGARVPVPVGERDVFESDDGRRAHGRRGSFPSEGRRPPGRRPDVGLRAAPR